MTSERRPRRGCYHLPNGGPMSAQPVASPAQAPVLVSTMTTEGGPRRGKETSIGRSMWRHRALYLMALPGIAYFVVFKYLPMGGLVIAFQDYQPFLGLTGSPWVGFEHFVRLFTADTFFMLLRNTLPLSALLLVFSFPMPIILALMLNELRGRVFKRSVQSIVYLPHFMSWVIVVSIFYVLLTTDGGALNNLLVGAGGDQVSFLTDQEWLR